MAGWLADAKAGLVVPADAAKDKVCQKTKSEIKCSGDADHDDDEEDDDHRVSEQLLLGRSSDLPQLTNDLPHEQCHTGKDVGFGGSLGTGGSRRHYGTLRR